MYTELSNDLNVEKEKMKSLGKVMQELQKSLGETMNEVLRTEGRIHYLSEKLSKQEQPQKEAADQTAP